jgi:hypothetical protein
VHAEIVQIGRHNEMTFRTSLPADLQSKGGSEGTAGIAKADLIPTDANPLADYHTFGQREAACREFCEQINARVHRADPPGPGGGAGQGTGVDVRTVARRLVTAGAVRRH